MESIWTRTNRHLKSFGRTWRKTTERFQSVSWSTSLEAPGIWSGECFTTPERLWICITRLGNQQKAHPMRSGISFILTACFAGTAFCTQQNLSELTQRPKDDSSCGPGFGDGGGQR